MPSMPKVRASSGMMGTTCLPMFLSRINVVRMRTSAMVVEISRPWVPSSSALKVSSGGNRSCGAALLEIFHLLAFRRGFSERETRDLLVRDRNVEPVADRSQIFLAELFLLVCDVQAFRGLAEPETLHGFREDHGGSALVGDRGLVGGIHLHRIVTAAIQAPDLIVGHIGDHFLQLGIFTEEMFARIRAA